MNAAGQPRGRRPAHGEPVLDRAFRILTAFGPDRSLSLSALSVRAALPKPTALRLARKLAELGALERTRGGEYVIGLRLLEIASLAPRGHGLRATALPYMEDLHLATGQHVLLAVQDGGEAILVERLSARGAGRVMYRVGGRLPLHSTGVGLVLLAHAPAALQDEILGQDLTLRPENIVRTPRELRAQLAGIRRDGVAVAARTWPEPVTSVAAPIRGGLGSPVAALSVVTRTGQVEPAVLRPAVVAVARAISRALAGATLTSAAGVLARALPPRAGRWRCRGRAQVVLLPLALLARAVLRSHLSHPQLSQRLVDLPGELARQVGARVLVCHGGHVDQQPGVSAAQLHLRGVEQTEQEIPENLVDRKRAQLLRIFTGVRRFTGVFGRLLVCLPGATGLSSIHDGPPPHIR